MKHFWRFRLCFTEHHRELKVSRFDAIHRQQDLHKWYPNISDFSKWLFLLHNNAIYFLENGFNDVMSRSFFRKALGSFSKLQSSFDARWKLFLIFSCCISSILLRGTTQSSGFFNVAFNYYRWLHITAKLVSPHDKRKWEDWQPGFLFLMKYR